MEKALSMPQPALVSMSTQLAGSEDDKQILEHYQSSFEQANQMLARCENLSGQFQLLFSSLKRKIHHEIDEILFQIDDLTDWLEETYRLFMLKPINLGHADQYLLVDWQKIFANIKITYSKSSFLDTTLQPGESSVDVSDVTDWVPEPKHTAECILDMIKVHM